MTTEEIDDIIPASIHLLSGVGDFISLNSREDAIGPELGVGAAWEGHFYLRKIVDNARKIMNERGLTNENYINYIEEMIRGEFERLMNGKRLTSMDFTVFLHETMNFLDRYE